MGADSKMLVMMCGYVGADSMMLVMISNVMWVPMVNMSADGEM